MPDFVNIAAYRFAPLTELKSLRQKLIAEAKRLDLKGTILLSPEGINLFMAGTAEAVQKMLAEIRLIPGLETLEVKCSKSDHQPFNRLLVRLKKEIIAFGVEGIQPGVQTSPKLPAKTLKQWLDEGRQITLLDTRNDYEVKLGTFKGARDLGIRHFRDFPDAVCKWPLESKDETIVMFCTGGIRCEKAGPFMEREGFKHIYQLEGGILKYFEECGSDHYEGECFVFDQRVGVDPSLRETESTQCFQCLTPLTKEDQDDPRYQPPQSCPHCFKTSEDQQRELLIRRQEEVRKATTPLPGCTAYDNERPIQIPQALDGATLLDALTTILRNHDREEWRTICGSGVMRNEQRLPVNADQRVRAGDRYWHSFPGTVEPSVNADIKIVHEDEALVVVNKPAPLPVHPSGRFNKNTLQFILHKVYHPLKPRPAHRLDANTTGVMVFTKTRKFAGLVQPQFDHGLVCKKYLALVCGHPSEDHFECRAEIGSEPSELGSRAIVQPGEGLSAWTIFRVRHRNADGTSLLEVEPKTGRTNQIRVHLWHLGMPIVGDPVYRPNHLLGDTQTLAVDAPPLCLHALSLRFRHPVTDLQVEYEAPSPAWSDPK